MTDSAFQAAGQHPGPECIPGWSTAAAWLAWALLWGSLIAEYALFVLKDPCQAQDLELSFNSVMILDCCF